MFLLEKGQGWLKLAELFVLHCIFQGRTLECLQTESYWKRCRLPIKGTFFVLVMYFRNRFLFLGRGWYLKQCF